MKKLSAIMITAALFCAACPMTAAAGQHNVLERAVAGLQQKLTGDDAGGFSSLTLTYLDEISAAAAADSTEGLQLATAFYVAGLQQETQAVDNATKCSIQYFISTGTSILGLVKAAAAGDSAFCMANNLTNKVADLMSAKTKFDICVLETAETVDQAQVDALTKKLIGIETYDFVTNAIEVFACTPAPSAGNYIGLVFNFIGIFPKK